MIRLATNETPYGPFPSALEAVASELAVIHRYPERDQELIARLAEVHGLPADRFALGNGGDAIIGYLSSALLRPGDEVLTGWPSFPTYDGDALRAGAVPVHVALTADGAFDLDALAARIGPRTRLVWVCTPNNPTGASVTPEALARFLDVVPPEVLTVVDEAYYEFAAGPGHADALAEHVLQRPNVGVLRTFSKMYGLAALRVGWFAGPPEVAAALRAARHFYDVTDPAAVAALASLGHEDEVARRREANRVQRGRLQDGLDDLGVPRLPSDTNFVTITVDDAAAVAARLFRAGIAVRSLEDLGSPELLRITVGAPGDVDAVLAALPDALAD